MSKTIIGLTGNIATGKSAIMRTVADKGVLALDADKIVHHILATHEGVQEQIAAMFGREVLTAGGQINRAALGRVVFNDPAALARLEGLIHPEVRRRILAEIKESAAPVIMIEAIKLLEGELATLCDQIWVADCGKLLQLQRLVIGRGMDEDEAFSRIAGQSPQADKVAAADVVIDTTGTLNQTREQVLAALEPLLRQPTPAAAPAVKGSPAAANGDGTGGEIVVRRARPSDVPSILLLIHHATGGKIRPKRREILMSLSDRGYLIGQQGAEISAVVGWYADKGFGAIDQMYLHPTEAAETTGRAVLGEIDRTANELLCEAIFAFVNEDTPDAVRGLLADYGFVSEESSNWPRVWQQTFQELRPEEATRTLIKRLWHARIA